MRSVIIVSVLVILLACACAGDEENEESKRDLSAEDENLNLKVQRRGLGSWIKKGIYAAALWKVFGKREEELKRDLELQRRALSDLFEES